MDPEESAELLAISTEDGRIVFYSTKAQSTDNSDSKVLDKFAAAEAMFYMGGKECGVKSRIKDFHIISPTSGFESGTKIIVTAGSDGAVMIWKITGEEMQTRKATSKGEASDTGSNGATGEETSNPDQDIPRVGTLLAKYDTGNRITCIKSFELHGSSDEGDDNSDLDDGGASEQGSNEDHDEEEEGFEGFQ